MSWTYSGNPQDSPRDLVRFLLGDNTQDENSLSDEELDYLIAQNTVSGDTNAYHAASEAASVLHNRYIGLSSSMKKVGDLTLETHYTEQARNFGILAERLLKGRTAYSVGAPAFWDTSSNTFTMGMMDSVRQDPRLL